MEQGGVLMMRQLSNEDDGCNITCEPVKLENFEEESGDQTVFLSVNTIEYDCMSEYSGWNPVKDPLAQDGSVSLSVVEPIAVKSPKKYLPNILRRRKTAESPNVFVPPIIKQLKFAPEVASNSLQKQIVFPHTPTFNPIQITRLPLMNSTATVVQPIVPPSSGICRKTSKVQAIAPKPGPIIVDSCSLLNRTLLHRPPSPKTPSEAMIYDRGPDKNGIYSCTYCNGKFKTCGRARNHEARAHNTAPCVQQNVNTKLLKQGKDKSHDCVQCGLKFVSDCELRLHMEAVHNKLVCKVCHRKFTSQSYLEFHMSMHRPSDTVGRFHCPDCGRRCRNNRSLQKHISMHKRQELHCDLCSKVYTDKTALKLHMKRHLGILPHKCDECDLRFVAPYLLRRHKRSHTGERPFKCRICGDTFNCCGTRYRHMSIHGDVPVYACSVCGEGTKSNRAALVHCNGSSFGHL